MAAATPRSRGIPGWVRVSLAMFIVGAGANIFAALLPVYKGVDHLTQSDVTLMLGVYVLGLIPALLIGGPASDKYGRRALIRPALVFTGLGSGGLIAAHWGGTWLIHLGRLSAGAGVGCVMAAGAAWLKELSEDEAVGARRATVATSAGFGIGPLVGGIVGQWVPMPDLWPLVAHLAGVVLIVPLAWSVAEPRDRMAQGPSVLDSGGAGAVPGDDSRVPMALRGFVLAWKHPHFMGAVAAWAPWVFGCATTSFAVLTSLVQVQHSVAYTGGIASLTMLSGVAVQQWVPKLRWHPATVGLLLALVGMLVAIAVAVTHNPWIVVVGALFLGSSYGVMMVSGLREVQHIARPSELGALTGVYYSLTYVGFFAPFVISYAGPMFGYVEVFCAGVVVILVSLVPVRRAAQRALDADDEGAGR